jgi:hypothetical protein
MEPRRRSSGDVGVIVLERAGGSGQVVEAHPSVVSSVRRRCGL